MSIEKIFNLDENGCSDWVSIESVIAGGLNWSSNGNMRHGKPSFADGKKFEWEAKRVAGPKSTIIALKTLGYSDPSKNINSSIKEEIKISLRKNNFCNFSLVSFNKDELEVDHRWGHKTHEKYNYINNIENQKIEDFQLIHRSINSKKRQVCKDCIKSKTRPDPPLGKQFVIGSSSLDEINVCNGCFYAQPELYRS